MMQNQTIYDLINMGEGQQLDFKHSVNDAKKIARSLVAFANTDGGTLLLGVKDNGRFAGIRSEEEVYMIETASHLYSRPEVKYTYNLHKIDGKNLVEIIVEPSMQKPHKAPDTTGNFKVYIRKNDENLLANRVLLEVWKLKEHNVETVLTYDFDLEQIFTLFRKKEKLQIEEISATLKLSKYKTENILIKLILMDLINIDICAEHTWYYPTDLL